MAIQLIEAVQKRLSLPELVKITPDQGVTPKQALPRAPMHQAALVTVAGALYKITRTNEGAVRLLLSGKNGNWLDLEEAYGSQLPEVIEKVMEYGVADAAAVEHLMRQIADTCLLIMHEELTSSINPENVREFMSAQRHNILIYVPADLKLGKLLNDSVWDDQTNHMEGPVSSLLHKIENLMSK
jgi:hypothetical protein